MLSALSRSAPSVLSRCLHPALALRRFAASQGRPPQDVPIKTESSGSIPSRDEIVASVSRLVKRFNAAPEAVRRL